MSSRGFLMATASCLAEFSKPVCPGYPRLAAGLGEEEEQQGQQKVAATEEQLNNFKKAFSVCLEAKSYMVKF